MPHELTQSGLYYKTGLVIVQRCSDKNSPHLVSRQILGLSQKKGGIKKVVKSGARSRDNA